MTAYSVKLETTNVLHNSVKLNGGGYYEVVDGFMIIITDAPEKIFTLFGSAVKSVIAVGVGYTIEEFEADKIK